MLEIIISRENPQSAGILQETRTWETLNSLIRCKNTSKDVILNHNGLTVSDPPVNAEVLITIFQT